MKRFFLPALLAIAAISGTIGYFNQPIHPQFNALGVANVEALSYDEWGYDTGCMPIGDGCLVWPSNNIYWYPDLRSAD